jgi:hypothetical protein
VCTPRFLSDPTERIILLEDEFDSEPDAQQHRSSLSLSGRCHGHAVDWELIPLFPSPCQEEVDAERRASGKASGEGPIPNDFD